MGKVTIWTTQQRLCGYNCSYSKREGFVFYSVRATTSMAAKIYKIQKCLILHILIQKTFTSVFVKIYKYTNLLYKYTKLLCKGTVTVHICTITVHVQIIFFCFFSLSPSGCSLICLLLTTKKEKDRWGYVGSVLFDIIKN